MALLSPAQPSRAFGLSRFWFKSKSTSRSWRWISIILWSWMLKMKSTVLPRSKWKLHHHPKQITIIMLGKRNSPTSNNNNLVDVESPSASKWCNLQVSVSWFSWRICYWSSLRHRCGWQQLDRCVCWVSFWGTKLETNYVANDWIVCVWLLAYSWSLLGRWAWRRSPKRLAIKEKYTKVRLGLWNTIAPTTTKRPKIPWPAPI